MEIALQLDDQVREKLKDQELSLQYINQDEIQIMGDPRSQLVGKLLFSLAGILVTSFSMIFAQGEGTKSIIVAIIGSFIGLSLIVVPFYNSYVKKQFRILISRIERCVSVRSSGSPKTYPFDEINVLMINIFKMDDYVNDETAGSTTYHCKFFLKLNNGKEAPLFTFSSREKQGLEKFSEAYGQFLADFISKPFVHAKK